MCSMLKPVNLLIITCLSCLLPAPAAGVAVSADTSGGYGAQLMDIIIQNWTMPLGATGSTSVIVRITNDGRPFSCELRKSSGNSVVDDSICMAVAKAGIFPPTPYAAPAEVALTFLYDAAVARNANDGQSDTFSTPEAVFVKSYQDMLMDNAREQIQAPQHLKGDFTSTIRLLVRPDGTLAEYAMEQTSGSIEFDSAVLRALLHPGVITPPPDGKEQNVYLTFSYKNI